MAKKKNVVISKNELEPTTLATINNKKTGFIGLIILFALFIGVVYFLPDIEAWYEQYKKGNITNTPTSTNTNTNSTTSDNDEEIATEQKYMYESDPTITNSDISINNFMFLNGVLTFDITNLKNSTNDLTSKKYYLSIYSNNTLIKRIKVAESSFGAKETKNFEYNIDAEKIDYFTFTELSVEDYPEVKLAESDTPELKCTNEDETINYVFSDEKLVSIRDIYTVNNSDSNYQQKIELYQNMSSLYNSVNGITVANNTTDSAYIVTTSIDLKTVDIKSIKNVNYYALDTKAKEVSFEMEARGFDCQ